VFVAFAVELVLFLDYRARMLVDGVGENTFRKGPVAFSRLGGPLDVG